MSFVDGVGESNRIRLLLTFLSIHMIKSDVTERKLIALSYNGSV
jgi:hypothetical protein